MRQPRALPQRLQSLAGSPTAGSRGVLLLSGDSEAEGCGWLRPGAYRYQCAHGDRASASGSPSTCNPWRSPGGCRFAKEGRTGPGGITQQPKAPVASGGGIAHESEGTVPARVVQPHQPFNHFGHFGPFCTATSQPRTLHPSAKTETKNERDTKKRRANRSRARFRSSDLWVMGPARFHCATLLLVVLRRWLRERLGAGRAGLHIIAWPGPGPGGKTIATAENRTRINCLEGNYANHYTTVAALSGDGEQHVVRRLAIMTASSVQVRHCREHACVGSVV